ncbi:hypothetical protein GF351_04550 [Candidatus Woesearchaeota archaeon]|nr:hypothetical protein [Candidatus Woesearchaeota archaeon]
MYDTQQTQYKGTSSDPAMRQNLRITVQPDITSTFQTPAGQQPRLVKATDGKVFQPYIMRGVPDLPRIRATRANTAVMGLPTPDGVEVLVTLSGLSKESLRELYQGPFRQNFSELSDHKLVYEAIKEKKHALAANLLKRYQGIVGEGGRVQVTLPKSGDVRPIGKFLEEHGYHIDGYESDGDDGQLWSLRVPASHESEESSHKGEDGIFLLEDIVEE